MQTPKKLVNVLQLANLQLLASSETKEGHGAKVSYQSSDSQPPHKV
jgi:hypothetical protein